MPIETPESIINAIEHCLKPIARLCIHFGIDHRKLNEMLKGAFVSVANEEFKVNGKSQTDSRIALLTGVHRKDVRRLLGRAPNKANSRQLGLVANLIAQWLAIPELLDEDGDPKPIPRNPQPNHKVSFTSLAEALTNDIHPRALMDECVNRGIVKLTDDDMVHLIVESLVPADDLDEKAHFFGQNIHDHIAAAEHNLNGNQPPFLDRFVWHEGLTEADTKMIAAAARRAAMNALKLVNNQAVHYKQQHYDEASRPEYKIHFGTFFYSCKSSSSKTEDDTNT
jgi:hypothetical protein